MTRVVKDVLRLGNWKVGLDHSGNPIFWNVTPQVLATLATSSLDRIRRGDAINFGKSHGDEDLIIPTDDLISPIDDLKVANGVLWVSSYVTPDVARYLANPARKVSVGVKTMGDYIAGDGTGYPLALAHVAVTDRPVVTAQGPFLALSNSSSQGTTTMKVSPDLIKAIDMLLTSMGLDPLPPEANEQNLVELVKAKAGEDAQQSGPVDDVTMCNRIAKRTGQSFESVWSTMPKFNGSLTLANALELKKAREEKQMDDNIERQTGHRPDRGRDHFQRWMRAINSILKSIQREALPADTTLENFADRLEESAKHLRENPILIQAPTARTAAPVASAAMANRQSRLPSGMLSDAAMEERLKAKGIDPRFMPRYGN